MEIFGITPENLPGAVQILAGSIFVLGVCCWVSHKGVFDFIHKNRHPLD